MVPVSALNGLRRLATDALEEKILAPYSGRKAGKCLPEDPTAPQRAGGGATRSRIAVFTELSQIPLAAYSYFDKIFLPAPEFVRHSGEELSRVNGVQLPAVIFDSETERVREMLLAAKKAGVRYALVGNLGHVSLAKEMGFELCGGSRLNVSNVNSAQAVSRFGFEEIILHPELTLPKCRDVARESGVSCLAVVYGKVPLMIIEKCVICESLSKKKCELCPLIKNDRGGVCRGSLTDRTGAIFPVVRELGHRNVIYNSVPVYMADKKAELDRAAALGHVFIFSDETSERAAEIIRAFESSEPSSSGIRRMGVQQN
jgi:putative protease